jgi:hypothetical protein
VAPDLSSRNKIKQSQANNTKAKQSQVMAPLGFVFISISVFLLFACRPQSFYSSFLPNTHKFGRANTHTSGRTQQMVYNKKDIPN